MRWIRKGALLMLLLIAAIGGYAMGRMNAGLLNIEETPVIGDIDDSFESFRAERRHLRQMELSRLNEIAHDNTSEAEIAALAKRRIMRLMEWADDEQLLEGILKLRDFKDPLVVISENSVNVFLHEKTATAQQIAMILELVTREIEISAGNVKIIPIN